MKASGERHIGFHSAMDHTGAVVGPFLAIITLLILFQVFGMKDSLQALRWTFLLAIIPGILAVLTIILFVKEPAPAVRRETGIQLFSQKF